MSNVVLNIPKAQGHSGFSSVPNLMIVADKEIDVSDLELEEIGPFHNEVAVKIVEAMLSCLPGGLVDAVFAELARRKASLFSVRLVDADDDNA